MNEMRTKIFENSFVIKRKGVKDSKNINKIFWLNGMRIKYSNTLTLFLLSILSIQLSLIHREKFLFSSSLQ